MDLEETKKEAILLTVNEIVTKLDELNLNNTRRTHYNMCRTGAENERKQIKKKIQEKLRIQLKNEMKIEFKLKG